MSDEEALGDPARRRRRWIALGAAVIVILLIGWSIFGRGGKPAATPSALQRVTVVEPGRRLVAATVVANGVIAAKHDMQVGVVGEGGQVVQVLVNPGDWVKAGQPLAIIERSVQAQQAASLAASIKVAAADAALAQSNLDRAKALVKNGFISKADIDAKVAARDQAVARVAVARAQLGEQSARNARLVIRAPKGGLVLTRAVEPGQIVMSGQGTLFRIAEDGNMEMQARIPEQELARMAIGTPASVIPIGSAKAISGQIWQISPVIDPTTRQGFARIALPYDTSLRPGGFAEASISSGKAEMPLLPQSAVLSDDKGNFVYVVGRDNAVVRRAVKIGDVSDVGVSIIDGLSGREKVVVSAGAFLTAGEKIQPELTTAPAGQ
ncbi:RND family efflux transporter MFP subunit [Sphingomonas vulcanisoli]|uniref:RND family efflux transporter MFP subunit n=1 Tax=Sphingomonas vulcanisoli TaxID=1658060 RepID=A0ABX0TTK3_9SPHN|nr:RND family efflux transporter MFP subunit [Sphingomonas vulcanisoli]